MMPKKLNIELANKLFELKNAEDFFPTILANLNNPGWSEIISYLKLVVNNPILNKDLYLNECIYSLDQIETMEKLGVDFNYNDVYGNTLLNFLLINRTHPENYISIHKKALDYLKDKVDSLNNLNANGNNFYDLILCCGHLDEEIIIQNLMESNYDFDKTLKNGDTPIIAVIRYQGDYKNNLYDYVLKNSNINLLQKNENISALYLSCILQKNIWFHDLLEKIDLTVGKSLLEVIFTFDVYSMETNFNTIMKYYKKNKLYFEKENNKDLLFKQINNAFKIAIKRDIDYKKLFQKWEPILKSYEKDLLISNIKDIAINTVSSKMKI